ncbi:MAG: FecR domain-containing protein [Arachidicoccus sp.]|nr:FecR domain-containing protein [Arachidicoccus sp.]
MLPAKGNENTKRLYVIAIILAMQFDKERIIYLLNKAADKSAAPEEEAELLQWYNSVDFLDAELLDEAADNTMLIEESFRKLLEKQMRNKAVINAPKKKSRIYHFWIPAAAAVLFAFVISVYFISHRQPANTITLEQVMPGHDGAVLTLADGSSVALDSAGKGIVARQGNAQINNTNGQLSYLQATGNNASTTYNTLSTPRGRQYRLVLPDGSKAWLNAASSIRYPVAFSGKQRKVEITGEVYFEIVHKAETSFIVSAGNAEITDLGTHFNVSAYEDEPLIKATLLEGSIAVNHSKITPGEQAQVNKRREMKIVTLSDAEDAVAWQKGD